MIFGLEPEELPDNIYFVLGEKDKIHIDKITSKFSMSYQDYLELNNYRDNKKDYSFFHIFMQRLEYIDKHKKSFKYKIVFINKSMPIVRTDYFLDYKKVDIYDILN